MSAIKAPDTYNVYQDIPALNKAENDFVTSSGVRVCTSVYVDIPMNSGDGMLGRKDIFNKLRSVCNRSISRAHQPKTMSGIQVQEFATLQPYVERYLGCSMDTLRSAIWWQRGALPIDIVLKVQSVIGETIISDKDHTAAFSKKAKEVKEFSKLYPFTEPELS